MWVRLSIFPAGEARVGVSVANCAPQKKQGNVAFVCVLVLSSLPCHKLNQTFLTQHPPHKMAPTLKLVYFPFPTKPEAVRLAAHIGGLAFEDEHIDFPTWGASLKAKVAPQQLPLLHVDGEVVGQSNAILRYVGRLTNLYPEDARVALSVDETIDYAGELFTVLGKFFALTDDAEKKEFAATAVAEGGDLHKWLVFLDSRLAGKKYAVGDSLTVADLSVFTAVHFLVSGFFEGIPSDALVSFKNLAAHKAVVANHPKVKEYYASAEGLRTVFKA